MTADVVAAPAVHHQQQQQQQQQQQPPSLITQVLEQAPVLYHADKYVKYRERIDAIRRRNLDAGVDAAIKAAQLKVSAATEHASDFTGDGHEPETMGINSPLAAIRTEPAVVAAAARLDMQLPPTANSSSSSADAETRVEQPQQSKSLMQTLWCCFVSNQRTPAKSQQLQVQQKEPVIKASAAEVEVEQQVIAPPTAIMPQISTSSNQAVNELVNGRKMLLPPTTDASKICLVLDLDETLVHSSFKPIPNPDFIIPVEIDSIVHNVYVLKRPHVDHFLATVGPLFEVVIFTASLRKYADPVCDQLDPPFQSQPQVEQKFDKAILHRLFRESCVNHRGTYVKDLAQLGRPLDRTIILDNSPASYLFHPTNAVPVTTWFNDSTDNELKDLADILESMLAAGVADVREVLNDQPSTQVFGSTSGANVVDTKGSQSILQ